ncbi:MAG: signal peptidase I [Candidatus Blackburnbacteria bacterium]|nr:signal peptidase I [Candidatus Blackburnbacteria bacterium]
MGGTKAAAVILDLLQTVVLAFAIFLIVYLFLVQPHQVRGESMYPNFDDKEYLLTDKLSYRFGQPGRGDIVIFAAPPVPTEDYIKRITALPGDKVMIKDNLVFVNNQPLKEDYLPPGVVTSPGPFMPEGKEIIVGKNEYIVLGDNRPSSSDSRRWGPVKRDKIVGRAWFAYWPPNKVGVVR